MNGYGRRQPVMRGGSDPAHTFDSQAVACTSLIGGVAGNPGLAAHIDLGGASVTEGRV